MTIYLVHHMKPDHFCDGMAGLNKPTVATLANTDVPVRHVEAEDLDTADYQNQGEVWSPNGEARDLIRRKGLRHTSMSVGDVIEDVGAGRFYIVASVGFDLLD